MSALIPTRVCVEKSVELYLFNHNLTQETPDVEWRYAVKSISRKSNLSKHTQYFLTDSINNQRVVRIAQELIDLGEDVGNFKIKPTHIVYDISGRMPQTIEAAKAWDILSNVLTLHRQKYTSVNPDYKAEALLTGIYSDCVFLISLSFFEADLVTVSKRLQFQGHKVATFVYVE
ncbi:MAG: hypothetical protein RR877_00220 [Aurantimicrobium sp.]|uniref:hypothetical protein n=1 Tax=Aurantimicrobium sp. TaxID=1930784 RepID=UPI002FCC0E7B